MKNITTELLAALAERFSSYGCQVGRDFDRLSGYCWRAPLARARFCLKRGKKECEEERGICKSRRALSNNYFIPSIDVDTAEDEQFVI